MDAIENNPPRLPLLSTPLARLVLLLILVAVLLVPLGMIGGVVHERSARRAEAVADITASWSGAQAIVGPVLRIRCVERHTSQDEKGWVREQQTSSPLYVLPDRLQIDAGLRTEIRRRGLFDVPVYAASLNLRGHFARPQLSDCPGRATSIEWDSAELLLGLREPRGLHADARLEWNGAVVGFKPATGVTAATLASGVHAALATAAFAGDTASFTMTLGFNGAQSLRFAPMAKETTVAMTADWPHPSYSGGWLPTRRSSEAGTFAAHWSTSYLGRDYPQTFSAVDEHNDSIERSLFGVDLLQPIDPYVMAERITKYAVLTLVFTFLTVWLTEVLSGRRVHPIQYAFIGAALCLFGLLQLALAEHVGFAVAFALAAVAVTTLVTLYCRSALQNTRPSLLVGGLLTGLYGYLYSLLRAEDYALLGGALALFALLAAAMYLTRGVDWFGAPGGRPAP